MYDSEIMEAYYSKAEEMELVRQAQAGCIESRNKIIMSVDKLAWQQAHKYARGNREKAEILHAEAMAGLVEKFHQYKLEYDCRFTNWALNWIFQKIVIYLKNDSLHGIRIPISAQEATKHNKSDYRTKYVEAARRVASADAENPDTDTSIKEMLIDRREKPPDDDCIKSERIQLVQTVLARLQPRYRDILVQRVDKTLEEVAETMGVTRERVRQVEAKAQQKFMEEAERIGSPIVQELEEDIRNSNRTFARRFLNKETPMLQTETTTRPTKAARIEQYLQRHGAATKNKDLKQALGQEGYTVYDSEISHAKRKLFGDNRPAYPPAKKSSITNGADVAKLLQNVVEVKKLAANVGGLDDLANLVSFLKALQ